MIDMPRPTPNLIGKEYADLTVIAKSVRSDKGTWWVCKCICGMTVDVRNDHLTSGRTKSCGCLRGFGISHTTEYNTWRSMIRRCHNENAANYDRYGARGITVCDRWRKSFRAFLEDMGLKPSPEYSIDRIDNNGPYEPKNCRWSTPDVQAYNRRSTVMVA